MPTSTARIEANRKNCLKSSGPKTIEGKQASRRNGLKHGLTGAGIVLVELDAAEIERRSATLRAEMAPRSEVGEVLVRQLATLSVRMERGAIQESAAIAANVLHAKDDFDEARIERASELLQSIGENPRRHLRWLRKFPEGVDALIDAWDDLRSGLTRKPKPVWTASEMVAAANLLGIDEENARDSTIGELSQAAWGDFSAFPGVLEKFPDEEGDAAKAWGRARLVERIDQAIAELKEHRETLDFEMIEQDRDGAPGRALFDPSKEACLARRYEAAANRAFYRALKEFRESEAAIDRRIEVEVVESLPARVEPVAVAPKPVPKPAPKPASAPAPALIRTSVTSLASSCQTSERPLTWVSPRPVSTAESFTIGRPPLDRGASTGG